MYSLPSAPTENFPYRILELIGEGAMGQVFRAEDIELGRPVAIKAIRPDFIGGLSAEGIDSATRRFLQEARAAAALSHPGVATVYRVGSDQERPYIAMEWIEGRTLEERLRTDGPLRVEQAAHLGLEVLAVLEAAHRAGIVHRDIKPANLMLTRDRRIKVTDFGIAHVEGSSLARTRVGAVMGTPRYAAPEQLAAEAVDGRADLYALGAVLYEAVTGQAPFDADSLYALILAVQTEPLVPASHRAPGTPAAFDELLARALAKSPRERFQTAREMARALQPFLTPQRSTPRSSPPNPPPPTPIAVVPGHTPAKLVAGLARRWTPKAIPPQPVHRILEKLLDRPFHAPGFSGAAEIDGRLLLIAEGVLFEAVDPRSEARGDVVIEELPKHAAATLYLAPSGDGPALVGLLASLLGPSQPRIADIDPAFVDLPQLVRRLGQEAFEGSVRFALGDERGYAVFHQGRPLLTLLSAGWDPEVTRGKWEESLRRTGARVSLEDRRHVFPAITYRQRLREARLLVLRPGPEDPGAIRSDARARTAELRLASTGTDSAASLEDSTLFGIVAGDPAVELARWLMVDVPLQFEQFGRTARWKAMLEPLSSVEAVALHHSLFLPCGRPLGFDAATLNRDQEQLHVIERAAIGGPVAVDAFLGRVTEAKAVAPKLAGALLVAPRFTEDSLALYLERLNASKKVSLRSAVDLFTHREGLLYTPQGPCHVLLVEESEGRRRPLVPQG